jgi:hypothetical protein
MSDESMTTENVTTGDDPATPDVPDTTDAPDRAGDCRTWAEERHETSYPNADDTPTTETPVTPPPPDVPNE